MGFKLLKICLSFTSLCRHLYRGNCAGVRRTCCRCSSVKGRLPNLPHREIGASVECHVHGYADAVHKPHTARAPLRAQSSSRSLIHSPLTPRPAACTLQMIIPEHPKAPSPEVRSLSLTSTSHRSSPIQMQEMSENPPSYAIATGSEDSEYRVHRGS